MKLKVQQVFDVTLLVTQIIRENRPMPQKGKYRLSRLHAKLLPEFTTANARRDEMITAYQHHETTTVPMPDGTETTTTAEQFSVPTDKMPEFNAAWKEIADEEIEIEIDPIPLAYLDLGDKADGSISANELVTLADLVKE